MYIEKLNKSIIKTLGPLIGPNLFCSYVVCLTYSSLYLYFVFNASVREPQSYNAELFTLSHGRICLYATFKFIFLYDFCIVYDFTYILII